MPQHVRHAREHGFLISTNREDLTIGIRSRYGVITKLCRAHLEPHLHAALHLHLSTRPTWVVSPPGARHGSESAWSVLIIAVSSHQDDRYNSMFSCAKLDLRNDV